MDLAWTFCPACGADNRDPAAAHPPIPAHAHDFRNGVHCVVCGLNQANAAPAPSYGYLFSRNFFNRFLGVMLLPLGTYGLFRYGAPSLPPSWIPVVFVWTAGILLIASESRRWIDLPTRTVNWSKGIWPVIVRGSYPIDQCYGLELFQVSEGRHRAFRLSLLRSDGRKIMVDQSINHGLLAKKGQELGAVIGLPFHDVTPQFGGSFLRFF